MSAVAIFAGYLNFLMELNEKEKKEKPDNDQRVIFSQMENVICKLSAWQILKCLMISFNLQ